jgi:hypothetical protein
MAKKKATDGLAIGTRVRVKPGTSIPEFPDVECGGWTGTIVDSTGKKPNVKCVVEWDESTLSTVPEAYIHACEAQQLYHRMACLDLDVLEPAS